MKRTPFAIAAALIGALLVPLTPATADTESITPTSEIEFDNQLPENVRFDALGRAWIWNTVFIRGQGVTKPRLAIFEKESGNWERVRTVKAKKRVVNTVRFDPNGQPIATVFGKNEVVTWRVSDSGAVGKSKHIALRGRGRPLDAFPNASGSLFVLYRDRIVEFDLPLRRKERPVRTINAEFPGHSSLVALANGTIFAMPGATDFAPIRVYEPNQSGAVDPARTILIDSALSSDQYALDIALSPDGKVAVAYWNSGVALFEPNAFGNSVTPATWYPQEAPVTNLQGVDFGPSGVMGIVDFDSLTSVKVFFESDCPRSAQAIC
jgi:WD40 repeat protein